MTDRTKKDVSYSDFLDEVLRGEREAERCRAREMVTRVAGFPTIKTLGARPDRHRGRAIVAR